MFLLVCMHYVLHVRGNNVMVYYSQVWSGLELITSLQDVINSKPGVPCTIELLLRDQFGPVRSHNTAPGEPDLQLSICAPVSMRVISGCHSLPIQ